MLWFVVGVAACAALVYAGYAIEPHWVSADGDRFLTTAQEIDHTGRTVSRRREVRGTVTVDGLLVLGRRSVLRTRTSTWRVVGRDAPARGRYRYVLDAVPPDELGDRLALRVPRSSRLVARLDRLVPPVS